MGAIMHFNLDIAVISAFLSIIIVVGVVAGFGVKTIKDYALGGRNFSTATLTATIAATWISGNFFAIHTSGIYKDGIFYLVAGMGDVLYIFITGLVISSKMNEFLGSCSVAEIMGKLFGSKVRLISAIASVLLSIGQLAIQVQILSMTLSHFLGLDAFLTTITSSVIIIGYSSFGGIRAVTFTDVIQCITFGVFVPVFAMFIWQSLGDTTLIAATFNSNTLFDYTELVNTDNPKFWPFLFLFLFYSIPGLNPTMVQRMLMAKDSKQIKSSFLIAGVVSLVLYISVALISIVMFSHNPSLPLEGDNIIMHIIDNELPTWLKSVAIISIMAMVMSTADSWINASSVLFAHDICPALKIDKFDELKVSRIFAISISAASVVIALSFNNLLELMMLSATFYMPIVTAPLLVALFGFRTSGKVVMIAMGVAAGTVIFWKWQLQAITGVDSVMIGVIAHIIALFAAHYLLGEDGGGTSPGTSPGAGSSFGKRKNTRRERAEKILQEMKDLNILSYCNKRLPESRMTYIYFSIAAFLTIISIFSIEKDLYNMHTALITSLQAIVFSIATAFLCKALWSDLIKEKYLGIIWYVSIFTGLALISSFLVLLSKFSYVSLTILIMHLITISLLVGWRMSIIMIAACLWMSFSFYEGYIGEMVAGEIFDLKLKMIYLLLMTSGLAFTFLRSKQEQMEKSECKVETLETEVTTQGTKITTLNKKVGHYSERVSDQAREIERLGATAQKILNNVNHELRLPVGNVMNFAEMLRDGLEKYDKEHLKMLSEEVYNNSTRLSSMILNMLDLATLNAKKIELKKEKINFSKLVHERFENCRNIYAQDKKALNFHLNIEDNVLVFADINYIRQMIDNLVINAINFSEQGTIAIIVNSEEYFVSFTIKDKGKGIPKTEIYDIFTPFKMGSNTESKAEGRGVGLALCKAVMEAHGGKISAESRPIGALFRVCLPYGKLKGGK
ncbi:MAG: hypothetical protein COA94_04335 [Rickettsiales bacterium]|nr:MAG: hypothetical protein COA94_04335 [Rickettsiales bacterium]